MILVTGSTGGLGKATIDALLKKIPASEIIALARDVDKASDLSDKGVEVRQGDYLDYDALVKAFEGVEKLVLISAPTFTDREAQHFNAIRAAKAAGVKHLYYTGMQTKKNSDWIIPMATESDSNTVAAIKESGITYTYVRNTVYADSLGFLLGTDVLTAGVSFPSGEGRITYATRTDLGEGLANLVIAGGYDNQEVTLSNTESWSSEDIAAILSEIKGAPVPFHNGTREVYVAHLESIGFPFKYADFGADWAEAKKAGEFENVDPTLKNLLGRTPTTLRDYLKTAYPAEPISN